LSSLCGSAVGAAASEPKMLMPSPNLIMQSHGASLKELPSSGSMCCRRHQPLDGRATRGGLNEAAPGLSASACSEPNMLEHHVSTPPTFQSKRHMITFQRRRRLQVRCTWQLSLVQTAAKDWSSATRLRRVRCKWQHWAPASRRSTAA